MTKRLLKVASFAVAFSLLISSVALAETTVEVREGGFELITNTQEIPTEDNENNRAPINFDGSVTINMDTIIPSMNASDYIRIEDNRGTNLGWNVKVVADDLEAKITDPKMTDATMTVKIPISAVLTMQVNELKKWNIDESIWEEAQDIQNNAVSPISVASSEEGVSMMSANERKGAGAYSAKVNYTLNLKNYLPEGSTVDSDNEASPFNDISENEVQNLGLFAGNYSTTITYAYSTAP